MIVTLPLAGGCIRENMDDCKGKVTLRFRYVGDGTTDIFPEKIEHVTMYVYSIADGSLAAIQKYDDNALAAYQGADVMLFPGRYEVVCWGNALDETTINEGEKIAANGYFENTDIATNDPLYYGTIEIEVPETLAEWHDMLRRDWEKRLRAGTFCMTSPVRCRRWDGRRFAPCGSGTAELSERFLRYEPHGGRPVCLPNQTLSGMRCVPGAYFEAVTPDGALRLYPESGRSAAEWKLAQEYLHERAGGEAKR